MRRCFLFAHLKMIESRPENLRKASAGAVSNLDEHDLACHLFVRIAREDEAAERGKAKCGGHVPPRCDISLRSCVCAGRALVNFMLLLLRLVAIRLVSFGLISLTRRACTLLQAYPSSPPAHLIISRTIGAHTVHSISKSCKQSLTCNLFSVKEVRLPHGFQH